MRLKKIALSLAVLLAATFAVFLSFHANPTLAYDGSYNQGSRSCGEGKPYCYYHTRKSSGGLIWIYVPKLTFALSQVSAFAHSAYGYPAPGYLSGSVDCSPEPDAEGVYILAQAWYKVSNGHLSGYFFPLTSNAQNKKDVNYETNLIYSPSFDYGNGNYSESGYLDSHIDTRYEEIHQLHNKWYIHFQQAKGLSATEQDAERVWQTGDFNFFCGSDEPPTAQFASKTNVFYAESESSGVKSVVGGKNNVVSSDFKDGETDTKLELTVEPGATVALYFNSYLKANNATNEKPAKTQFYINHDCYGGNAICSSFRKEYFFAKWTDFTVKDTDQHSVVEENGVERRHVFNVPDTDPVGTEYTLCEHIWYKKSGVDDTNTGDTKACAKIVIGESSMYEGKSEVAGRGTVKSSPWGVAVESEKLSITVKSIATTQDIEIAFSHALRATDNVSHSTTWTVEPTRDGSLNGISIVSEPNPKKPTGLLATNNTDEHVVAGGRQYKLTIGANLDGGTRSLEICETLHFKTSTNSAYEDGWSKACAVITVFPADTIVQDCPVFDFKRPATGTEASGETAVFSGVKNFDVPKMASYFENIYAKPYDDFQFAHCYYPEAQMVRYTKNTSHSHSCSSFTIPRDGGIVADQNEFHVDTSDYKLLSEGTRITLDPPEYYRFSSGGFNASGNPSKHVVFKGTLGSNASAVVYSYSSRTYNVRIGNAGTMIKQKLTTIGNDSNSSPLETLDTITCPRACGRNESPPCTTTYTHSRYAKHTGVNKSDSAWMYVPYNFGTKLTSNITNGITSGGNSANEIVLANEPATITAKVTLTPRYNDMTEGTYVTEPPIDTSVQVISFFMPDGKTLPYGAYSLSDPCTYYKSTFGESIGDCRVVKNFARDEWMKRYPEPYAGEATYDLDMSGVNTNLVENIPVGYKFCTAVGIRHADSGDDINSYTGSGSPQVNPNWNISSPTCRTVANRPSLQVWGGNVYTSGSIQTSTITKPTPKKSYGSWAEFALIAGGTTGSAKGFASGASLGYDKPYANALHLGGARAGTSGANSLYYSRVPLSLVPENNEGIASVKASGIATSGDSLFNRLKTRYIDNANATSPTYSGSPINISNGTSFIETYSAGFKANVYRYSVIAPGSTITASRALGAGVTHIIHAKGDITIGSNLTLSPGPYTNIVNIPQYVILAEGNVYIANNVSQVDAWIIAKGSVDTCRGYNIGSNANTSTCGTHLTINGPVVAQSLSLKRSAGAGAEDTTNFYYNGRNYLVRYNSGDYGADSAETINLPLTAYLWAYSQATKFTEMYTVYMRELAPRL